MENRVCALHGSPRSASLALSSKRSMLPLRMRAWAQIRRIVITCGSSDPIAEEPLSLSMMLVSSGRRSFLPSSLAASTSTMSVWVSRHDRSSSWERWMHVCMCVCQCTDSRLISDEWQCGGQCCRSCTPSVPPRSSFLILPPCEDDASGSQNSVWAAQQHAVFALTQKLFPLCLARRRSLFAWEQIQRIIVTCGFSYPIAEEPLSPSCLSRQGGAREL
jgi:hypothetical protein